MSYSIHHPTEKSCLVELRYRDTLRRESEAFPDRIDENKNRHLNGRIEIEMERIGEEMLCRKTELSLMWLYKN